MTDFSSYNLTPSAKEALVRAQEIAGENGHLKVIDVHLIYSIFKGFITAITLKVILLSIY